jgi:hypothetical protein
MSTADREHVTTQTDQPASQRRMFLDVLGLEIRRTFGFEAGVEMLDGCLVLHVVAGAHSTAIGCDLNSEGWWFTWPSGDHQTITPVADYAGTAYLVARILRTAQADLS